MWDKLSAHLVTDEQRYLVDSRWVAASFERCRNAGIDPTLTLVRDVLDDDATARLLTQHARIVSVADALLAELHALLPDKSSVFFVTTADAHIIALFSAPDVIYRCSSHGFRLGTSLSEASCGTNAVALALRYREPVVARGRHHYCRLFHNWCLVAAPIVDSGNETVGCICLAASNGADLGEKIPLVRMLARSIASECSFSVSERPALYSPIFRHRELSKRQHAILLLLIQGKGCKEIAASLDISVRTVESHLEKMRQKFGAKTTIQLVATLLKSETAADERDHQPVGRLFRVPY